MTRFARKGGINEKKEEKKKQHESTDWGVMLNEKVNKKQTTDGDRSADNEEKTEEFNSREESGKRKHIEDCDKRIESEGFFALKKETKSKATKSKYEHLVKEYSSLIDSQVMDDLFYLKDQGKITYEELIEHLKKESRSNNRRLNRIQDRESSRTCFKCRKSGHSINECPDIKKDMEHGTGICYKCGSTEHLINNCKAKVEPGKFPFAKCFICNEIGHLTKQCPDNPRGLYPNGGSCITCGSVEHYKRDCPEKQKQSLMMDEKTVKKLKAKDNFENLSDDDIKQKKEKTKDTFKVVLFK